MAEMKISNTLVNDTLQLIIAYARLLLEENYGGQRLTQSQINDIVRLLRLDFDTLVGNEEDVDDVINTFHEIEEFLSDYREGDTLTSVIEDFLKPIKTDIRMLSQMAIELDLTTGQLVAIYNSDSASLSDKSLINPETGKLEIVYNF